VDALVGVDETIVTLFHLFLDFTILVVALEVAPGVGVAFYFLLAILAPHKTIIKERRNIDHQLRGVLRPNRIALILRLLGMANN